MFPRQTRIVNMPIDGQVHPQCIEVSGTNFSNKIGTPVPQTFQMIGLGFQRPETLESSTCGNLISKVNMCDTFCDTKTKCVHLKMPTWDCFPTKTSEMYYTWSKLVENFAVGRLR